MSIWHKGNEIPRRKSQYILCRSYDVFELMLAADYRANYSRWCYLKDLLKLEKEKK